MWPSMVGVVHCDHTGAAAAQVSERRRAIFIRGERYMQILVSSLAWVWPAVADWKQIVAARLSKVASTLVPLHRALVGPGKRPKMYTNLPLRAEQIFFPRARIAYLHPSQRKAPYLATQLCTQRVGNFAPRHSVCKS